MYRTALNNNEKICAVAPMMDWTDRHCRYFHRLLSKKALLYTEMVVADALIYGDVARHLDFTECEHPIALQLGGSEPEKLAKAAKMGAQWGYDEINLNVGCPSDRVQSGTFGACLMRQPHLVAECVARIKDVVDIPVTVKCRIGVDDQDPQLALSTLAEQVFKQECDGLWVHARKAWLQGLSPKENRDIPPLDYNRVHQLKQEYPDRFIAINGGIKTAEEALSIIAPSPVDPTTPTTDLHSASLGRALDGAMIGRAAYQNPSLLSTVDKSFYGVQAAPLSMQQICAEMMDYATAHIAAGGRLHHVTRHMIGLFQGRTGARRYRQILSVEASPHNADAQIIQKAFDAVLSFAPTVPS